MLVEPRPCREWRGRSFSSDNVAEKQRIARGYVLDRSLPTQRAVLEYETLGWWLTIGDNSFYLGAEKPDISVGDRIGITIERISE
jgi:hypothetical protein